MSAIIDNQIFSYNIEIDTKHCAILIRKYRNHEITIYIISELTDTFTFPVSFSDFTYHGPSIIYNN